MKFKYSTTIGLISILLVYFIIEIASDSLGKDSSLLRLGALSDSGNIKGEYWRFFTYSLLHSGFTHLLMNCLILGWTGRIAEKRVSGSSLVIIYVSSVLLGGILINWWKFYHPTLSVTIGASAGVFGVLSAALLLMYRPTPTGIINKPQIRLVLWLILLVSIAVSFIPGVSFVGHLGGLICGILLGSILPIR